MAKSDIEDIYPLTPLQEGMLYHALLTPGDAAYHDQFSAVLRGPLAVEHLVAAWQAVARNHAIFRTAFAWKSGKAPLQVVGRQAATPVEQVDWRGVAESEQRQRRAALIRDDAARGFDPAKAPLTRLTLARLADDAWFLLWSRHHLLLDGWSVAHVLREWLEAYAALQAGQAVPPTRARPFRDYLAWLKRQDTVRAEAYWRAELGDFSDPTPLGLALPTGRNGADRHAERTLTLTGEESAALQQLARDARVTLATVFQGAWALLLARFSGERDVVFGHTVSGRPPTLERADSMVGLFINTLPLRARLTPGQALGEWLQGLQSRVMAAREFEHTPLVQIQGWSEVPRDRSLFETLLVFENYPVEEAMAGAAGALQVEEAHSHERTHYPATLIVAPGEQVSLLFLHDRNRIPDTLAERWLAYLRQLLRAMAPAVAQPLGTLHGLDAADWDALVRAPNETALAHDRAATLSSSFAAQVARTPAAIAVRDGAARLSYAELATKAAAVAARLRALGVGPEDCVGVCLPRGADLVVGLLGVLAAGAAYVPLDPTYPTERLGFMFTDAKLVAVVTGGGAPSVLPEHEVPMVDLGELEVAADAALELAPVDPANLAYLIYTSGSTGRPKATAIEHRQAVALVHWAQASFSAEALRGVLFSTSVCFDLSVFELFVTLSSGGTVIVAENALVLPDLPARDEVTLLNTVPSAAAELVRQEALPANLATINLAGEPLTADLADRLYALAGVREVNDLYGPSEDTTYSTHARREPGGAATIGRVIANSQLYLVDADLHPVPDGAVGEIVLAGEGVARGYLGRPDLTADRFVPNPFATLPGDRLYRTGDLARRRPDGQLDFLGRSDHQVKIRGFRIELGEIQARLEQHPAVSEAAVLARDHTQRGKYIVAFVVAAADQTVSIPTLQEWVRATMPVHMTPSRWHALPSLPRTPNGKLDRRALPVDTETESAPSAAPPAALDPMSEIVRGIWAEVLGVATVGPEDNFFDLGGHSLLATQVVARVRTAVGADCTLRLLFDHPTVRSFATAVRLLRDQSADAAEPAAELVPAAGEPVISPAQQRLWVLARLSDAGSTYHLPAVLEARGVLDRENLIAALDAVVARHESLRTVFPPQDDRVTVRVLPELTVPWREINLPPGPEADMEQAARREAVREVERPFDLEHGPLLRAALITFSPERHWVVFTVHHLVTDGWSEAVLVRELGQHLAGQALPPLVWRYRDYARWQQQRLAAEAARSRLQAWADELAGMPALELPTDRSRPATQTYRGGMVRQDLDAATTARVETLAGAEGVTPYMVLLAAWQVWLWRHSGQTDFGVGTPVAGRTRAEWEPLIGLFVNTLVLRSDVAPELTVRELLRRVRSRTLRAHDRQDTPFERVVEAVQPARDPSRSPLFQVMFSLQNTPKATLTWGGVELTPIAQPVTTAKFDLTLTIGAAADARMSLNLEYNRDLFDETTAAAFLARYAVLVGALVGQPKAPLKTLPWMTPTETTAVMTWSRGRPAPAENPLGWTRLEERARRHPDAPAVSQGTTVWTYTELLQRAAGLADTLRSAGIGPGAAIGVCGEREPALVAAMLACWGVRAAYVPLDPANPDARLRALVTTHGLNAVLTAPTLRARWDEGVDVPVLTWETAPGAQPEVPPLSIDGLAASDVAYVLFTSGSTGEPKGVAVSQGALAQHLNWFVEAYAVTPSDVVLQKTPFTFDASVWEFWVPLMAGGRLELAPPQAQRDPAQLLAVAQAAGATLLQAVPTLWEQLVAAPGFAATRTLRHLFAGGEVLTAALRDRLSRALPVPLTNLYGPTEATIQCATWTCGEADGAGETIPLGRPVPGTRLWVLDATGAPVAPGVVGELHVAGGQLADGYWRRPDLTAERFKAADADIEAGGRWYATGDLVRWRPDGVLEYVGRSDDQVKVRGFRVELGEVEAALAAHPGVSAAAVVLREGRLWGYVAWPDAPVDWEKQLRRDLNARLAAYMVPARLGRVEAWPLLPSGKIDRAALPNLIDAPGAAVPTGAAPTGEVEPVLAALWRDLLGVATVGREDNFFALGGDSIIALQVAARAARAGVQVPAQAVFAHPTLAELAAVCTAATTTVEAEADATPVLTPAQRWFFELGLAQPAHWNQSVLLETPAGLDSTRLEQALMAVASRHDVLRNRYQQNGDTWTVMPEPGAEAAQFSIAELADLASACEQAQAGLDLATGPLLRAVHFVGAPGGAGRLLLVAHHLVIDGVSWRILLGELSRAYAGETLPAPTTRWSAWTRALAAEDRSAERAYWTARPAARPLPRDLSDVSTERGLCADEREVECRLTTAETAALLRDAGQAYGTRINDLLLTAWARAMGEWTGWNEQSVMLEGHGREELATTVAPADALGWFTALYPVSLRAPEDATDTGAWIKTVKEQLRAVPARGLGYGLLRYGDDAAGRETLMALAEPEFAFNYLGQVDVGTAEAPDDFPGARESRGPDRAPQNVRPFLLEVNAAVTGGELRVVWSYSVAHHRPATIEDLAARFAAGLRELITHCTGGTAGGFTASDFTAEDVSQSDLDKLFDRLQ